MMVKVAGPPPCMSRATRGSRASSAVDCRKNRNTRSKTVFRRGDCKAKFRPTRIAPTKRSPGRALVLGWVRQVRISATATPASTALSTNTKASLKAASKAPASTGPITRDRFIAMPLSAMAGPSCSRGTTSGTMAANTGQRIARPMPLTNVSASSSGAVSASASARPASNRATMATQSWVAAK